MTDGNIVKSDHGLPENRPDLRSLRVQMAGYMQLVLLTVGLLEQHPEDGALRDQLSANCMRLDNSVMSVLRLSEGMIGAGPAEYVRVGGLICVGFGELIDMVLDSQSAVICKHDVLPVIHSFDRAVSLRISRAAIAALGDLVAITCSLLQGQGGCIDISFGECRQVAQVFMELAPQVNRKLALAHLNRSGRILRAEGIHLTIQDVSDSWRLALSFPLAPAYEGQ